MDDIQDSQKDNSAPRRAQPQQVATGSFAGDDPAASAQNAVVELSSVAHKFNNHRALINVSFRVPAQSLHGFVGPNGAGKTTALKLICTLLKPQTGSVRVFGMNVANRYKDVRKKLGFMPDHFSMYRQMTVYEYLDFFAAAYGIRSGQRNRVLQDVLELTDMGGRSRDLINGLSRGMQQRVGLARVLVNDPDLLLLDEPASGLDPRARIELMEILRALQSMGKTIIISSHILSELAELCDSCTIIDRGTVKYCGTMEGLLESSGDLPTWTITPARELSPAEITGLSEIDGVASVDELEGSADINLAVQPHVESNWLLSRLIQNEIPILAFKKAQKHLNDAFMDLTEKGVRD
jgi:ABC-2 type transport system ATP-binding protein